MIEALTHGTVWDAGEIQYTLAGGAALDWDAEFVQTYYAFYGSPPDGAYAHASQTRRALAGVDASIGLDLRESASPAVARDEAELVMVSAPAGDVEGFFTFPGTIARGPGDSWSLGAISSTLPWLNVAPERGGGEYLSGVLLHEIGHALGLVHSHEEAPGRPAQAAIGPKLDDARYTVMSYRAASTGDAYGHPVTMMALDLAALHALYGAEEQAVGDSSYTLAPARQAALDLTEGDVTIGRAYHAIWDTGGTDTIDVAGDAPVMINLNAATLDRSGVAADAAPAVEAVAGTAHFARLSALLRAEIADPDHHAGGFFSRVLTGSGPILYGLDGGYAIADGASIENATGGAGADLLIGNEVANVLAGGGGDDTLVGSGGDDRLDGGDGVDVAAFSDRLDSYELTPGGSLTIAHDGGSGADGTDRLDRIEIARFADAFVSLTDEAVTLVGTDAADLLLGRAGDTLIGLGGDDTIRGGAGADTIWGDGERPGEVGGIADLSDLVAVPDAIRPGARAVRMDQGYALAADPDIEASTVVPHLSAPVTSDEGYDYFALTLGSNATLRFDIDATSGVDTMIRLLDADGALLAQNDDADPDPGSEGSFDSLIVTTQPAGTYYLEVASFGPGPLPAGASYTLHVSNPLGPVPPAAIGDDVIEGGAGGDMIDGGAGTDRASYSGSSAGVTVDLAAGTASGGHADGDTLARIENLTGSAFADQLTGDGGVNDLAGGAGNDILRGQGGADRLDGGAGADILFGGAGGDLIIGGAGLDFVSYTDATSSIILDLLDGSQNAGDAAGDTLVQIENLVGSNLADTILGGNVANTIFGRGGNDVIDGRGGADLLRGEGGADELIGGAGFDRLEGGAGNDTLRGGSQADELFGEAGADILFGGAGGDLLDGGAGFDFVSYTSSTSAIVLDILAPGANAGDAAGDVLVRIENLVGSNLSDTIRGGNVANQVLGRSGDDTIDARGGADLIDGGAGADTMTGGQGFDTFRYQLAGESTLSARDTITDFTSGQDAIDLAAIDAGAAPGNQALAFVGTAGFSGSGTGEVRYGTASGNTTVTVDTDGNGAADMAILLTNVDSLNADDFIL